jgi:hypothetical protein
VINVKTECRTQYGSCPFELESGKLYQTKQKIAKSLKNNFLVIDYSTQFKFPNILLVNVLIKKPFFVLKNDANQSVAVGADGIVLSTVNNSILPTVIVLGNLKKVGEIVDTNHLFALKLIQGVYEMYQINTGKIIDNSLVVELPEGIEVIFPIDGDIQVLLGSLRLVYSKKDGFHEIDLRFKNPVLR